MKSLNSLKTITASNGVVAEVRMDKSTARFASVRCGARQSFVTPTEKGKVAFIGQNYVVVSNCDESRDEYFESPLDALRFAVDLVASETSEDESESRERLLGAFFALRDCGEPPGKGFGFDCERETVAAQPAG